MRTAFELKPEDKPRAPLKNIVVIFDGDCTNVSDIINLIVNPRKSNVRRAKVSVIGFADAAQRQRIIDVINDSDTLPQ